MIGKLKKESSWALMKIFKPLRKEFCSLPN